MRWYSQQGALSARVAYNHLISNKHEWNNGLIKNSHIKILIKIKVLTLFYKGKEQNEDAQVTSGLANWYNGSNTMISKPIIKTL